MRQTTLFRLALTTAVGCHSMHLLAQNTYHTCKDIRGVPVVAIDDSRIRDVAVARLEPVGTPVIRYNPAILSWYQPLTREFWFAHECGHHALGHAFGTALGAEAEEAADCYAINELNRVGGLKSGGLGIIQADVSKTGPGNSVYPPGPVRAARLATCLSHATTPTALPLASESSSTCRFDRGSRRGQTQSFIGMVAPIAVGQACTDGQGSFGVAVADRPSERSTTCFYNAGPKAGSMQSFGNTVQPVLLGLPCWDGVENYGKAVPDGLANAGSAGALSKTCSFNSGSRRGTVQHYGGGVKPVSIGMPCTDGAGSYGLAIPD